MTANLITQVPANKGQNLIRVDGKLMAEKLLRKYNRKSHLGKAYRMQKALFDLGQDTSLIQTEVTNTFSDGVYVRTMAVPAGVLLVGARYKHPRIFMLLSGTLTMATEDEVAHYTAPAIVNSPAGAKRVVYMHTDTIACTIIPTTKTNVDEILAENIHHEEREYL